MHVLFRIVCVTTAVTIVCSHTRAAEKNMPIDFVGDWCSPWRDDAAKNTALYKLPSWTEDGHSTDILSIDKYGFYFVSEKMYCEPVEYTARKEYRSIWLRVHGYSYCPLPTRRPSDSGRA
jgi:hypothetical protein